MTELRNESEYDQTIRDLTDNVEAAIHDGEEIGRAIEANAGNSSLATNQMGALSTLLHFHNEPDREHYVEPTTPVTDAIFILATAAVKADIAEELKNRGVIETDDVLY